MTGPARKTAAAKRVSGDPAKRAEAAKAKTAPKVVRVLRWHIQPEIVVLDPAQDYAADQISVDPVIIPRDDLAAWVEQVPAMLVRLAAQVNANGAPPES